MEMDIVNILALLIGMIAIPILVGVFSGIAHIISNLFRVKK